MWIAGNLTWGLSMRDNETAIRQHNLLQQVESIPRKYDEPVFNEPWEAEVFAMTINLHSQGLFTWKEWAGGLALTIQQAQQNGDPDLGDTYYLHWLNTLERLVVARQIGDQSRLDELYAAWNKAALSTPHGEPIEIVEGIP